MVWDKYIVINDDDVVIGQYPSTGAWYCKELKAKKEKLKGDALFVVGILNELNFNKKNVEGDIVLKKKPRGRPKTIIEG